MSSPLPARLQAIRAELEAASNYPGPATLEVSEANVPRLLAAVEAVVVLHKPLDVFEYDDVNDTFKLDDDGEQIPAGSFCQTCSDSDVIQDIEDCEYDISGTYGGVSWPCPTVTALTAAIEGAGE